MPRKEGKKIPVFLERGCLLGMVMGAMEVYNRETNGLLVGRNAKRFIRGTLTDCVVLEEAYSLQTTKRATSFVMVGNKRAFKRARMTAGAYGFSIVGEFHSHPDSYPILSKDDKKYIRKQIVSGNRKELRLVGNRWLEVLIGIERIEYKRVKKIGWYPSTQQSKKGMVKGVLRTQPKLGFDIKIRAYWVGLNAIKGTPLFYSVY